MAVLLVLAVVVLMIWVNVAIVRLFRRRRAGPAWWVALSAAWSIGSAVGVWGGFVAEYQASPRSRVVGVPIPVVFFLLEGPPGEEQWVDFVTPIPFLNAGANLLLWATPLPLLVGGVLLTARAGRPAPPPETP